MDLRLPGAALLLGAAAFLGRMADEHRAPPPPGLPGLLGGFSAVATQALWMRAARALEERREDDAILALRAVVDLEPQLVSAARHAAETIGRDLAAGRPDAVRWEMAHDGLRILDRAVAANPGSADSPRERGTYLLLHVAQDPSLAAAYRKHVDADGPVAAARADLAKAAATDPSDVNALDLLGLAALREGMERIGAGQFDLAASALRESERAYASCRALLAAELPAETLAADPTFAALEESRALAAELAEAAESPPDAREERLEAVRTRHGLRE